MDSICNVSFTGFEYDDDAVDLSLNRSAKRSWTFDALKSGQSETIVLDFSEIINVQWLTFPDYEMHTCYATFEVVTEDEREYISIPLSVFNGLVGRVDMPSLPEMCGYRRYQVICIDTSSSSCSKTYDVNQILAGDTTTELKIYIAPIKSCTMTVRIEFETLDGEFIQSTVLNNALFEVPYYESLKNYIDDEYYNWEIFEDQDIGIDVFFPFSAMDSQ